jgi:hypothetical protein
MILESPKTLALDGGLTTWAVFVAAHGAAAVITALTISILLLRLMILLRQWRRGQ